jgi:hypothetical protein
LQPPKAGCTRSYFRSNINKPFFGFHFQIVVTQFPNSLACSEQFSPLNGYVGSLCPSTLKIIVFLLPKRIQRSVKYFAFADQILIVATCHSQVKHFWPQLLEEFQGFASRINQNVWMENDWMKKKKLHNNFAKFFVGQFHLRIAIWRKKEDSKCKFKVWTVKHWLW